MNPRSASLETTSQIKTNVANKKSLCSNHLMVTQVHYNLVVVWTMTVHAGQRKWMNTTGFSKLFPLLPLGIYNM